MECKKKCANYTDKFLRENVASPGSTVLMTPVAFMTKEAWISASSPIVCGLRSSYSIVAVNTQWLMTYIVDGFGPN